MRHQRVTSAQQIWQPPAQHENDIWSVRSVYFFFFQAEDGIRDLTVTGVQTCALPISSPASAFARPSSGPARSRRRRPPACDTSHTPACSDRDREHVLDPRHPLLSPDRKSVV